MRESIQEFMAHPFFEVPFIGGTFYVLLVYLVLLGGIFLGSQVFWLPVYLAEFLRSRLQKRGCL